MDSCNKSKRISSLRHSILFQYPFVWGIKEWESDIFSTELCQYYMNIMGIRKVIKPPNYVSVYDLRVQDRIKKKKYCVPTSTLKQTHFGTLITGVNQLIPRFRLGDVVGTSSHSWKILITNSIYRCDNWLVRCYWAFRNLTEVSTTFWDSRLIKKSIYNYHSFPWTISQLSLHWKEHLVLKGGLHFSLRGEDKETKKFLQNVFLWQTSFTKKKKKKE